MGRRQFLHTAAGAGAAALLLNGTDLFAGGRGVRSINPEAKKLIIIQFGGGLRSSESIDDPTHRYIPKLWDEMVPRGTLFTNMRVEHKVVHPNSTGSMMTGHWEWDDIDWSRPVANPTIFEIFRKAKKAPDTSAWAFVYASILAKTGFSGAHGFGLDFGANVVEPPTIPRETSDRMDAIMAKAAATGSSEQELLAAKQCASLARSTSVITRSGLRSKAARDFLNQNYSSWRAGRGTTSHDAFLTESAISCMRTFAPDVMAIDYGEIDCAHYGSWSRYVEAIERTDALTHRVWQEVERNPHYKDKTLVLILPDHGRELEQTSDFGFIHHSDFYTNKGADEGCRKVWMLALGPGVKNNTIDRPIPITAAAATGLEFLNLDPSKGAAHSVLSMTG